MFNFDFNLQLFADSGTLVNTTGGSVNAYTGAATTTNAMSPTMKTYYDTELLENSRSELLFAQFGKKQGLPANKGRVVEWRKMDTLPNGTELQEAVIPAGKVLGMTNLFGELNQYGMYVAISDILDMHAVDNILLGATEELGASAGETMDALIRNELMTGTNVLFADTIGEDGRDTAVTNPSQFVEGNNFLTPDMVNKAATVLKKNKAPRINGKYVAIIHPSVKYDLRSSAEWIEAHKYAATTEIFNGEIGELHGVRFIESTNAPIYQNGDKLVYSTFFMGKDAYGIVDPEGGNMEMIIKDKDQAGGPLNQFSTAGYKFEHATKILYPERLLRVDSLSTWGGSDEPNVDPPFEG